MKENTDRIRKLGMDVGTQNLNLEMDWTQIELSKVFLHMFLIFWGFFKVVPLLHGYFQNPEN